MCRNYLTCRKYRARVEKSQGNGARDTPTRPMKTSLDGKFVVIRFFNAAVAIDGGTECRRKVGLARMLADGISGDLHAAVFINREWHLMREFGDRLSCRDWTHVNGREITDAEECKRIDSALSRSI